MAHKKTVLIIDDELPIRESLKSFFEDEGYCVFTAEDGDKGLDTYFNEKIDLVLTDLRMPKKDGIEVMRRIHDRGIRGRAKGRHYQCPADGGQRLYHKAH